MLLLRRLFSCMHCVAVTARMCRRSKSTATLQLCWRGSKKTAQAS